MTSDALHFALLAPEQYSTHSTRFPTNIDDQTVVFGEEAVSPITE